MSIQVTNTTGSVAKLVESILNLPALPPSLYIDLKGISLSRIGSTSILTLYILPSATMYIFDIHKLGASAFSTEGDAKMSFQAILESNTIPKVFFDVRNDSDALYSHYQVNLAGVQGLHLMELMTRKDPKRLLSSLAKCIRDDADLDLRERMGRRPEVFTERPLPEPIIYCCAQDVTFLDKLSSTYNSKLTPSRRAKVAEESQARTALSQSAEYNPHGMNKALGPW
ncbi:hypothetical protein MMC29_003127 [Sticta canariensis]|nr:hypothetical protein [Sticta canariensis]